MASYIYKHDESLGLQIKVWKLDGHGETQQHYPECTEAAKWYEGHYLPNGEISCRTPDGVNAAAQEAVKNRWPTYSAFVQWCLTQDIDTSGSLNLSGCDLKGVKLPTKVGGSLDLRGCENVPKLLPTVSGEMYRN
jgi:hypothetical protein